MKKQAIDAQTPLNGVPHRAMGQFAWETSYLSKPMSQTNADPYARYAEVCIDSSDEWSSEDAIELCEFAMELSAQNPQPRIEILDEDAEDDSAEAVEKKADDEDLEPIGQGGMGQVRLARRAGQTVAVKTCFLKKEEYLELWRNELEIHRKFTDAPNVVRFIATDPQQTELVMEFAANGDLFDYHVTLLEDGETIPRERFFKIAMGIAKGLEFIHKLNIIHRDIKPENILLTEDYMMCQHFSGHTIK